MSRYNVFYLRAKGTEDSCMKCAAIVYQYDGHSDDPYIAAKSGTGDNYVIEMRGALRGDVIKYMIDLPPYEESLAGLSKVLDLEIEVFASDPGDGEFEHYYYGNEEIIESTLPSWIPPEDSFDDFEISEEDRDKYVQLESGAFALKKEYLPDAEWSEDGEEMICHFKIEMDEAPEEDSEMSFDKTAILAMMGITPDKDGFAISFHSDDGTSTLFEYFGSERKVIVPDGITYLEMGCFSSKATIEEVVLPESLKEIGEECFNDCPNLKKVVIPAGVEEFYSDTFDGSKNVVIYAPAGSGAEEFAKEKGLPFQTI